MFWLFFVFVLAFFICSLLVIFWSPFLKFLISNDRQFARKESVNSLGLYPDKGKVAVFFISQDQAKKLNKDFYVLMNIDKLTAVNNHYFLLWLTFILFSILVQYPQIRACFPLSTSIFQLLKAEVSLSVESKHRVHPSTEVPKDEFSKIKEQKKKFLTYS